MVSVADGPPDLTDMEDGKMKLTDEAKQAALAAARRSWYGSPSFNTAVLHGVEAAFEVMEKQASATRDMETGR